jgi:pyridoxamine 5'-phosphate oxidase
MAVTRHLGTPAGRGRAQPSLICSRAAGGRRRIGYAARAERGGMDTDGVFSSDPFAWFGNSFARALRGERFDASRAALATVDAHDQPSVRFVLVKHVDERGFVFFTNLTSPKASALSARPRAALAFHWESIGEQVRVEGSIERVSDADADVYFATRPRGSRLAAWASRQSAPIADRGALEAQFKRVEQRFAAVADVPRPPFWGGYRLLPSRIEFWSNREDRLHDRWSFTRNDHGWQMQRLQP